MNLTAESLIELIVAGRVPVTITKSASRPDYVGQRGTVTAFRPGGVSFGVRLDGDAWDSDLFWTTADNLDVDSGWLAGTDDKDGLDDAVSAKIMDRISYDESDNGVYFGDVLLCTVAGQRAGLRTIVSLVDTITDAVLEALDE
jgi:hypothetical protein